MKHKQPTQMSIGGLNFLITIHRTENHSWQGNIEWLDSRQKLHFRSSLEMMQLIDQAVTLSSSSTNQDAQHREWHPPLQEAK